MIHQYQNIAAVALAPPSKSNDVGYRFCIRALRTDGRGADPVIVAAGPAAAFEEGLNMVRRGGRFLVIGQATAKTVAFSPRRVNIGMLNIIGVVSAYVEHFYKAMQFLKNNQHRFNFHEMVTNSYSLSRVNDALEAMAAMREIKPDIIPSLG